LVSGWTTAIYHGSVATKTFLDTVESRKARDAAHIEQVAQDVREINAQVVGELTSAINTLAAIKLGSTIAIAALSGGASIYAVGLLGTAGAASAAAVAATAGMINTAYSVTGSLISNWHKAASAKVVGVTIEGAKAVGGKLAGDAGENMFKQGAAMVAANQEAMIAAAEKMTLARNGFMSAVRHKSRAHSLRAMAKAGDEIVCVLAPSDREVNWKKLANAAGAKSAAMMGAADADRFRALFRAIGEDIMWFSRLIMPDEQLAAILGDPRVESYAMTGGGGDIGLVIGTGYAALGRRVSGG
jgi:hypothetical protein